MQESAEHLLVIVTCPGSITAKNIATDLVANNLVACIQIFPGVQSYFRWSGKVEISEEVMVFIKTTRARFKDVEKSVLSQHPYELPEIIALPIVDGLPGYLKWITDMTRS